jgi:hypothetical protein
VSPWRCAGRMSLWHPSSGTVNEVRGAQQVASQHSQSRQIMPLSKPWRPFSCRTIEARRRQADTGAPIKGGREIKPMVEPKGPKPNPQGSQARPRAGPPARPIGGVRDADCREIRKWWARRAWVNRYKSICWKGSDLSNWSILFNRVRGECLHRPSISLGSFCSTIELHLRRVTISAYFKGKWRHSRHQKSGKKWQKAALLGY